MTLPSQNAYSRGANLIRKAMALVTALVLLLVFQQAAFAQAVADNEPIVIGEVMLIKGGARAISEMREDRDLKKGDPIYLGDVVETDRRSCVVIHFIDGGKLTLQPSSKVELLEFNNVVAQETQTFELLKGSLRAVTGAIGKRRPDQVTYLAREISVGIRGTTLAMRLCREGAPVCKFDRGVNFEGKIVANEPEGREVQLFIRGRDSDRRRRISREELGQYLTDSFVWVLEGKIRVLTAEYAIDMEVAIRPQDGSQNQPPAAEPGQKPPPQQQPAKSKEPKQPPRKAKKSARSGKH